MALKNYTTEIEAFKTVGEIQLLLSQFRITSIQLEVDNGKPIGLKFSAFLLGEPQWFHLKVNQEAVLGVLKSQKIAPKYQTEQQSLRVGWRILKDLVDAQLASVAIKQVELAQAFFGYAIDGDGRTTYEIFGVGMAKQLKEGSGNND